MKIGMLAAMAAAAVTMVFATASSAQSVSPPQGSYRNSCTDIRATQQGGGRLLSARCRTANGAQKNTSLRYENCRGDIGNRNGDLFCETGGGGAGQLPNGSYKQSCTQAYMSGYTLVATCRTSNGGQSRSSLDTRQCNGRDIANNNGQLTCSSGGGAPVPDGSYKQSCSNLAMNGSVLSATCRDSRGGSNRTSIDTRQCGGRDIANDNGRLTCSAGGGGNQPFPMPDGSFKQSCTNAKMSAWTLSANCRDSRGQSRYTTIDIRPCQGKDIANVDGKLSCTSSYPMPRGSYQQSCSNAKMSAWTLSANCRDSRGSSRYTTLDVRPCANRDIANVNGQLTCTGRGDGGGNASITLCTQPNYGGRCVTIDRSAAGLGPWEMANKAQSARVRGNWEICDQQDYRGRCTRIDRDVSDLGRIGYGKRISSVRQR
jgi:hypothetical protein